MSQAFPILFLLIPFLLHTDMLHAQKADSSKVVTNHKNLERKAPPPPPPPPPLPKEEEIFRVVEEMPRFPGCEGRGSKDEVKLCAQRKLLEFLHKNLQYPAKARENKVEGTCVVQFTVEKDGSVTDAELVRDIGYGCGEEALRIVNLMSEQGIRWVTCGCRGRPTRVRFTIPVKFRLSENLKPEKE